MANSEQPRTVIRVLVVDDHAVVRRGLRHLLESSADMSIVGEAEDVVDRTRSVRSEVDCFFVQIDDLGGYATERRISMMLSSGAVVVAAAMACEVARRQARRPAADAPLGAPWVDAPSRLGLPNFGSFSAFS